MEQAPRHQPQGQCGAEPRANSRRRAPSPAWWLGKGRHSPHTCSARRRTPDTWKPSPGLPSSPQGLTTSPGRAPFALGPPTRKRQCARAQGGQLPAPLSSSDLGMSGEGVSFSSNRPPNPSGFPQPLPCPATLQKDRQQTQRKKKKKKKLPPLLFPSSSLDPGGRKGGSTSSLLLPIPTR